MQDSSKTVGIDSDSSDMRLPALVRFIRVYGGSNEQAPPILLVNLRSPEFRPVFGERSLSLELDVQAAVPPVFRVEVLHCRADWKEDNNIFLNDIALSRSSLFTWTPAPPSSRYYSYRATMSLPNESIKIPYGGNWKIRVYDDDNNSVVGEARFFALDCSAQCALEIGSDFYDPQKQASPAALSLDCSVGATMLLSDMTLNTAVFYRLHRWNEPMVASTSASFNATTQPRFSLNASVNGIAGAGKRFQLRPVPAENDYRVLDLLNIAMYPPINTPIRLAISDLNRKGTSFGASGNAAMTTRGMSEYDDVYVPIEFVLDPDRHQSTEDVFVVGSFNGWKASPEWQMTWVEKEQVYKLRHWIRRGRHTYLYGTGRRNADTGEVGQLSFEEFEGNNVGAGIAFVCFVYNRDQNFGGYDNIVGLSAASIFGPLLR